MLPETRVWTRDEMMKRIALFRDLIGIRGGLPDSDLPEAGYEIFGVIGFQPPPGKGESGGMVSSPVGADAARNVAGGPPVKEFSEAARKRMAEIPAPA